MVGQVPTNIGLFGISSEGQFKSNFDLRSLEGPSVVIPNQGLEDQKVGILGISTLKVLRVQVVMPNQQVLRVKRGGDALVADGLECDGWLVALHRQLNLVDVHALDLLHAQQDLQRQLSLCQGRFCSRDSAF